MRCFVRGFASGQWRPSRCQISRLLLQFLLSLQYWASRVFSSRSLFGPIFFCFSCPLLIHSSESAMPYSPQTPSRLGVGASGLPSSLGLRQVITANGFCGCRGYSYRAFLSITRQRGCEVTRARTTKQRGTSSRGSPEKWEGRNSFSRCGEMGGGWRGGQNQKYLYLLPLVGGGGKC